MGDDRSELQIKTRFAKENYNDLYAAAILYKPKEAPTDRAS
jgi:hypothetical protein